MSQIRAKVSHVRGRVKHHLRNAFVPHEGNDYHPHALRRKALNTYGVVIIAVKVAAVLVVSFYAGEARLTSVTPDAIIAMTNQARQERKIATLKPNSLLQKAAQSKAQDMITKHYFAHISPTKITPWEWFRRAGYKYAYAGENLAIDFISAEDVVKAWLSSPSHRSNLLSTRYKEIGVATATGSINGSESLVVVQMFGTPVKPVVTKKTTKPTQTPTPSKAKATLATKKPPAVLGETATPVAPAKPILETPADKTLVRIDQPTFVGQAEPGSVVEIADGNSLVLVSGTVPSTGVFSLTPTSPLPEGPLTIKVTAIARNLHSTSLTRTFSIDTTPPQLIASASYALPALGTANQYDLWVTGSSEVTKVTYVGNGTATELTKTGGIFTGRVALATTGAQAGNIAVSLSDQAGNTTWAPLLDTNLMSTGVTAAPDGPGAKALRIIFFSRTFMTICLLLIFTVTAINLSLNWNRRHHPALLGLLLLMYVTGAMMIL